MAANNIPVPEHFVISRDRTAPGEYVEMGEEVKMGEYVEMGEYVDGRAR